MTEGQTMTRRDYIKAKQMLWEREPTKGWATNVRFNGRMGQRKTDALPRRITHTKGSASKYHGDGSLK